MRFGTEDYCPDGVFDELVDSDGAARPAARALCDYLAGLDAGEMRLRRQAIDAAIVTMGISFTTYDDGQNIDRAWEWKGTIAVSPLETSLFPRIEQGD